MTTCYASGGETAPIDLRSTDGGQSWTSLGTQFVSMNGSGVACRSAQRCTISTPGNSVRWTTDGTNWANASYNDPSGQDANRFLAVATPGVGYPHWLLFGNASMACTSLVPLRYS